MLVMLKLYHKAYNTDKELIAYNKTKRIPNLVYYFCLVNQRGFTDINLKELEFNNARLELPFFAVRNETTDL